MSVEVETKSRPTHAEPDDRSHSSIHLGHWGARQSGSVRLCHACEANKHVVAVLVGFWAFLNEFMIPELYAQNKQFQMNGTNFVKYVAKLNIYHFDSQNVGNNSFTRNFKTFLFWENKGFITLSWLFFQYFLKYLSK